MEKITTTTVSVINSLMPVFLFGSIMFSVLILAGITPAGITNMNHAIVNQSITPNVIMGIYLLVWAGMLVGLAKCITEIHGPGCAVKSCLGSALGITFFVYLGIVFRGTQDDFLISLAALATSVYISMLAAEKIVIFYQNFTQKFDRKPYC